MISEWHLETCSQYFCVKKFNNRTWELQNSLHGRFWQGPELPILIFFCETKHFLKKCLEGTMINPNPWAFCYWASYAISSFEWIPRIYFLHYFWDFTGTKHNLWCAVRSQVPSDWCAFRIGENIGTQFLGKTCPLLSSNTMWESHAFSDNSQSTIVLPELPGNLIQKYHRRWR